MFIHLSPIDSSCLSFSFVCLHMIIPPPCNFLWGIGASCCHPSGTSFFCAFCFERTFSFLSTSFFLFFCFCLFCFWQGCSMRTDYHSNIPHRVVWKNSINDVIKMRAGASKSLRDHQGAPCGQRLKKKKKMSSFEDSHHFCKPQFCQCTRAPVTQNPFWFQTVSSGFIEEKEEEKKVTLFVRQTKYSYAILNLLCLGCR